MAAGIFAVAGLVGLFITAATPRLPHGALIGLGAALVATVGILFATGALTRLPFEPEERALGETWLARIGMEPAICAPWVTFPLALVVLLVGIALGGYAFLPLTLLVALAALVPSTLRRPGLLLFVVVSALYLPLLGVSALWDPWETHYGEVAREILSRNDWISLWWAQDGWFWSKPILIFWTDALTMSAFGVDPTPDANPAHPEWALRLPIYAMAMAAVLSSYALVRAFFGARAGVLAGIALATAPHFFLLARQSITDMPLVACLTVSLCLLMLAFSTDPKRAPTPYRIGPLHVSARSLSLFVLLLLVLPQATYLVSRNATLNERGVLVIHDDAFLHGSAGNEEVHGNAPHRMARPEVRWPLGAALGVGEAGPQWRRVDLAQPAFQGALVLALLAFVIYRVHRERTVQGHLMVGFYITCGLGLMAKGLPALALPGLVALLYLAGSGRWSVMLRGELRIGLGILIVAVVGLPWYLAMYVRHGKPFLDRLLVHDHINRLAAGVHGDNGSVQYFLRELGYALFPWVALAPAAVAGFFWYRNKTQTNRTKTSQVDVNHRREVLVFLALWAVAAFALFSAMVTKFHHYIFPAVPPIALLSGILLERLWGEASLRAPRALRATGTFIALLSGPALALAIGAAFGDVRGIVPASVPEAEIGDWVMRSRWPEPVVLGLAALSAVLFAMGFVLLRRTSSDARTAFGEPRRLGLSVAMLAGASVIAFVGRDLSWETAARPQGYELLAHLFVYNYGRPWPPHIDYRPILIGFGVAATTIIILAASLRLRPLMARAFLGLALAFAAWGANVYMHDLADHWSIRPLVQRYYAARRSPEERFVAWQMNWKGENFYTGNRVEVFTQLDNRAVRTFIDEHQGERAFFALERTRLPSFRSLVQRREVRELTTARDCNKFVLVEVEL